MIVLRTLLSQYRSVAISYRTMATKSRPPPAAPRPSSSVIVISPQNEVLLLHRVKTSTSFASAHVFPGGNLSSQDGACPSAHDDLERHHADGPWYRHAAIRELFEESGILLARDASGGTLRLDDEESERGRRAVHGNQVSFGDWLGERSAVGDIDGLIPFSRWITPTHIPRRYTTQMYLYFLPTQQQGTLPDEKHVPTGDGGREVTEAKFLRASEWLRLAQDGQIILFPPQFLLLHFVAGFLDQQPETTGTSQPQETLEKQRDALRAFAHSGNPPWTDKCISPKLWKSTDDGRAVLALDQPGPELKGLRAGDSEWVVLVRFAKGEAREVAVQKRNSSVL